MEQFFGNNKIEISFNIVDTPSSVEGAKVQVDVGGILEILINTNSFFKEEDLLLLELAISLRKWLEDVNKNNIRDFYYESMDYEEQPILEFVQITNEHWNVGSVWQEFENKDYLDLDELFNAAKTYIEKLADELKSKFNLDVSAFIK